MPYDTNNIDNITATEVKTQLIAMGIYEDDMGIKEMRDLFRTIKQSEQSATAEKEYRETLYKANKNCTELLELIHETKTPDAGYSLRSKENYKKVVDCTESDEATNDTFFPTHVDKKDNNDQDSETDEEITTVSEKNTPDKSAFEKKILVKSVEKEKVEKRTKNIDVFFVTESQRQPLKQIERTFDNVAESFYCRSEIRNMPTYLTANAIKKYHEALLNEHKLLQSQSVELVMCGKGVFISLNKESNEETPVQNDKNNDNYCLRSRRQIKRKIYTEYFIDDEDKVSNKKSKDNIKTNDTEVDLNVAKQDFDFYTYQDKVFDNLRDSSSVNATPKKSIRTRDSQSSDEEHSTQLQVVAMVHQDANEAIPVKRKSGMTTQITNKKSSNNNNTDSIIVFGSGDSVIQCMDEEIPTPTSASKRKTIDSYETIAEEDCMIESVTDESKFVRRRIIPPNPLRDKMSQRSEQKIRNLSKRRNKNPNSITKPENQKTVEKEDDEELDDIFDEVTPKKINSKKSESKENIKSRTQPSRLRNMSPIEETEYVCPICDKSFPLSRIEEHAAGCNRPDFKKSSQENGGALCSICHEFLLHDIEKHLEECRRKNKNI